MAFQGLFGPDLNPPAWFDPALYGLGWFGEDLVAPPGAAASASVSEAAAAADSASGARSTPASVSEAAAAAEASQAAYVGSGAVTEAAAAGDSCDAVVVRGAAVTEPAAAGDAASALAVRLAAVSEPAAAADSASALAVSVAAVAESVTAMDFTAAGALLVASVSEPAAAGDAATGSVPGGSQFAAGVSEPAAAGDAVAASSSTPASVSEAAALDESVAAFSAANAVMLEPMTAGDLWALPPLDCRDLMICGMQKDLDRVLESSSTIGSGNIKLDGNVQGYRSLGQAGVVDGDVVDLYVEDVFPTTGVPTGAWECGSYTWRNGGFLERTTVRASSNNGAAVSWGVGVRRIGMGLLAYMVQAIRAVGGGLSSVEIVAPHVSAVETVAPHVTAIETVAPGVVQVEAVAADLPNVNAVAGDLPHIDAVALDLPNINAVAGSIAQVDAVAADLAHVDAVALDLVHIDAVALDLPHIDAVALDLPNIDAVAGDKANVDAVAANLAPINANVANMTAIQGAAPNAAAAAGSASQSNANMLTAIAQASLASIYALSAASVAQQDLSGVTAAALHRSPNAVVAMCIDDPRTWSDGGACLQRLDNLSWMNEPLNGAWSGPIKAGSLGQAEAIARGNYCTSPEDLGNVAFWSQAGGTFTMVAAPDGTNTMLQYFENTGSGARGISQNYPTTVNAGDVFVASAVLSPRGALGRWASIGFGNFFNASCTFDLTGTGAVSYQGAGAVGYITQLGGGQYLCSIMGVVPNVAQGQTPILGISTQNGTQGGSYVGDPTRGLTIWHPDLQLIPAASFKNSNPQLLPYSTFDYGTDGWAGVSATLTINASKLRMTSTVNGGFGANASFATVVGQVYTVAVDGGNTSFTSLLSVGTAAGGSTLGQSSLSAGQNGRLYVTFTATTTTTWVQLAVGGGTIGYTADFDNFSAQLLSPQAPRAYVPVASGNGIYFQYITDGKFYRCNTTWGATETFRGNVGHYGRTAWVAEAARLVGYAIDQPGRPMWMVFTRSAAAWPTISALGRTALSTSSITALGGWLVIGATGNGSEAAVIIDLAKDKVRGYATAGNGYDWQGTIAQRNSAMPAAINNAYAIASATVNSVAACVMPDAPVDPVTWLQVPTIALATSGGVSVIHNDGSVVNSSNAFAFNTVSLSQYVLAAGSSSDQLVRFAFAPGSLGAAFAFSTTAANDFSGAASSGQSKWLVSGRRSSFARIVNGLARLNLTRYNDNTPASSLAAAITDTYNTGWMAGDIRRCYLSDVSVGAMGGAEQLTNGTFPANLSGWTVNQNGGYTITWLGAGQVRFDSNGVGAGASGQMIQTLATTAGKTYAIKVAYSSSSGHNYDLSCTVGSVSGGSDLMAGGNNLATAPGGNTQWFFFTAIGATSFVSIGGTSNGVTTESFAVLSLVSVREAAFDRSYKMASANGLTRSMLVANGTLTKAQVGVGSQLVAYSGFSAANYLQEPAHSADLDPGTGAVRLSDFVNVPVNPQLYQNIIPSSNVFGAGALGWQQQGLTVADGSLAENGHTYALLQQPAVSTSNNRVIQFGTNTVLGVTVNGSLLVRRAGASTDRLSISIVNITGGGTLVYDPVTQTIISNPAALPVTVTVVDANTARVSVTGAKTVNSTSGYWSLSVVRASDGAAFGGGTGGLYAAEYQMTIGPALLAYMDNPGAVAIRCHPTKEYNYANGAYYTIGWGGDGFPMVEVWDTATKLTASASANTTPVVGVNYGTGTFIKLTGEYSPSGVLALKINAQPIAQTTHAPLLTLTNANALLTVGQNYALTAPFPGSITLGHIGMTVPSDDASRWMYEQEKEMFRDGAQVTLPDSGAVVDLDYDPVQDKWKVVSAANESSFVGNLVRTLQAPVSAGSFTHAAHRGGIKLLSRSTTNPGVDITIPAKNALEELNRRAEDARSLARLNELFDWSGQFVGTTATGFNTLTGVSGLVIPMGTTVVGAQIGGVGIPANTAVLNQVGTTLYLSANDTANGAASPQLQDYILPGGYEARDVFVSGALQREGSGFQYTRLYDGFRERVRLNSLPGNVSVRVNARRMA